MKVLFVNCVDFMESTLPEGIALLSALLKKAGHQVEIFDTAFLKPEGFTSRQNSNLDKRFPKGIAFYKPTPYSLADLTKDDPEVNIKEKFSEVIRRFKPSLIAISTMTSNYEKSVELIKNIDLPCAVAVGGTHPTLMPESVLREKEIDFVCVGEGDEALLELCDNLEDGRDTLNIKNIYAKAGGGPERIIKNTLRSFVDMDTLPVPDLGIFDSRHFFRPFMGNVYKGIFMSTSRGCPRGCAYCVNGRLRDVFKDCGRSYIRFQSPKTVARNIKALKDEHNIEWFKFSDDTFLTRPLKDMYELKELLKPLGIMFGCSVDPATVTEEKVRLAKEMGCVAMSIGIETGNEQIRRYVLNRRISNEKIKEAVRIMKDYDIKISAFNMIGLPDETEENIYETIRFNKELDIPDANVYIVYPYPGTKICYDAKISFEDYRPIPPLEESYVFNLSKIDKNKLLFFLKMFNIFLVLPESQWCRIEEAREDVDAQRGLFKVAQDIADGKSS